MLRLYSATTTSQRQHQRPQQVRNRTLTVARTVSLIILAPIFPRDEQFVFYTGWFGTRDRNMAYNQPYFEIRLK